MNTADPPKGNSSPFEFPPDSCDTHCHIFGPATKFPYASGGPYRPVDSPKFALNALHQRMGIARTVIVHPGAHGTDHAVTIDAIQDDPVNRRGVGIVDKTFTRVQVKHLHENGFRGSRFSFLKHLGGGPDADTFARVVDLIEPFGWHLVLHVTGEDLLLHAERFAALTIPIVFDHMGRVDATLGIEQPAVQCLLDFARKENCWIKVSGASRISPPPFHAAIPIAQAIIAASPHRCLWGTDFPHPNPKYHAEDSELAALIPLYAPDHETRQRLLVSNPAHLYGFPAA